MTLTVGFDLGGTKLLAVVIDSAGSVLAEARRPTGRDPEAVLGDLTGLLADLRRVQPGIAALGFGVAGLVDHDGVMVRAPNLPGWDGFPVQTSLEAMVDVPVVVDNDANSAAYGEMLHGAARGCTEFLMVTLGTGIGGALVAGGQVYRGRYGLAAEIGHITVDPAGPPCPCGASGHWESIASGTALGRLGRARAGRGEAPSVLQAAGGDPEAVTGMHVGLAAEAGAPDALAIIETYAVAVAVGLGSLVNVLDPELVVISGGLVELGDILLRPVVNALPPFVVGARQRPLPPVVAAALGERAGAIGAAALARDAVAVRR